MATLERQGHGEQHWKPAEFASALKKKNHGEHWKPAELATEANFKLEKAHCLRLGKRALTIPVLGHALDVVRCCEVCSLASKAGQYLRLYSLFTIFDLGLLIVTQDIRVQKGS